jgi:hypothetical protein
MSNQSSKMMISSAEEQHGRANPLTHTNDKRLLNLWEMKGVRVRLCPFKLLPHLRCILTRPNLHAEHRRMLKPTLHMYALFCYPRCTSMHSSNNVPPLSGKRSPIPRSLSATLVSTTPATAPVPAIHLPIRDQDSTHAVFWRTRCTATVGSNRRSGKSRPRGELRRDACTSYKLRGSRCLSTANGAASRPRERCPEGEFARLA